MTQEDFEARESELLARLPEDFRSTISYMAYERGHAYGYNEVLGHVESLVYDLLPAIEAYTARITKK